jgi:hypothetical protein
MAMTNNGSIKCVWCLKPVFGQTLANQHHSGNIRNYNPVLHLTCAAAIGSAATAALNHPPAYIIEFEEEPLWMSEQDGEK